MLHLFKNIKLPIVNSKTVFCILGPTAVGKTQFAIEISKHLPYSIISVDSSLVYRDMNIGSAKPSPQELTLTSHKLIDICDPTESYSAGKFVKDASLEIEKTFSENKTPLLVGGTMLYFYSLQYGLSDLPKANQEIRTRLEIEALEHGTKSLHDRLAKIDINAATRIQANDKQRLQRALELYELTGKTPTEIYKSHQIKKSPYEFVNYILVPKDKIKYHQKIEQRFDNMLQQGLIEEVRQLREKYQLSIHLPSMRSVGYRQVWDYLEGNLNYNEMRERAIIATRQLAKHQMTWLNKFTGEKYIIDTN